MEKNADFMEIDSDCKLGGKLGAPVYESQVGAKNPIILRFMASIPIVFMGFCKPSRSGKATPMIHCFRGIYFQTQMWLSSHLIIWLVQEILTNLVGGLVAIFCIFPKKLGMSSSQLTHIFQRGGPTTKQQGWFNGWVMMWFFPLRYDKNFGSSPHEASKHPTAGLTNDIFGPYAPWAGAEKAKEDGAKERPKNSDKASPCLEIV